MSAPTLSVAGTCLLGGGAYLCQPASALRAGQQVQVSFALSPTAAGTMVTTARATEQSYDDDAANNAETEKVKAACNPGTVKLTSSLYAVAETSPTVTISVSRSGGSCGAASVQYDTNAGSAGAGLDFTDVTGTLSWSDGESGTKTFAVPILDDALDEVDEKFGISLSNAVGASLASPAKASGQITDDDATPRINFTTAQQTVSEPGALATATVHLSAISGRNVTVTLSRTGSTATITDDFFAPSSITIPAGQSGVSFDTEVVDDSIQEGTEFVKYTLASPVGATLGTLKTHTIYINDDEPAPVIPTVSFTAATNSGDEATTRSATVSLSQASTVTITVPFTVSGTATQTTDYSLNRSSPLTFPAGTTTLNINSTPVDDAIHEGNETVVLTLGTPVNATLGATTVHTRTIVDNDP